MRSLFFLFTLLVSTTPSHAQVGFGAEAGIGFSSMKFAPSTYPVLYTSASANPVFSGKIGVVIDVPLNKNIYFQSGILFSNKGAVRSFSYYLNDSFNQSVHQTVSLHYFEVPLTVVYKSGMQGKGRLILGIGATPSYLVGGRNETYSHLVNALNVTDTLRKDRVTAEKTFKGFDIGVNLCAGYELPTGLFFRVYCLLGANDIGINTEIAKNRMFGISGGYFLGKGRNINKEKDDLIDKTTDK